jgi:RNA polymerase sigma-70 factor, ECF subfamily
MPDSQGNNLAELGVIPARGMRGQLVTEDERRLVASAQKGDRAALAAIVKSHEHDLYVSALTILGSSWDAQDAVQETLYEVCAKLPSLRDPAKFSAWLSRILVRKCYDRLRRRGTQLEAEDFREAAAHAFVGTKRDDAVLQAVASLADEQRLAIVLRFFLDLSYSDIEATTGWPSGTVKSRINRGLAQLHRKLSERGLDRDL